LPKLNNPTNIGYIEKGDFLMLQSLRRAGGSLVMTVPKAFIEQNGLFDGSQVELHLTGKTMTVEATSKPRYKLADLMAEMPDGLPRIDGWEDMPSVGLEVS
jgi:antitoxin ChpS